MTSDCLVAQAEVLRLTAAWRAAPVVRVVNCPRELPFAAPDDVRGAYTPAETFIVAQQPTPSGVAETVAHEVLGHHAMRQLPAWRSLMFGLQSGIRAGDARLQDLRADVRSIYVGEDGRCNLKALQLSDEITAALAERRFNPDTGRLDISEPAKKHLRAVAGYVAREGLYLDRPVDHDELEGALLAAEHRLRHGGPVWGLQSRLRSWYLAVSMPKWNPQQPPMSLDDSERLLAAEDYRKKSRGEWQAMGLLAVGVLAALFALWGIGYWVVAIFGGMSNLFR